VPPNGFLSLELNILNFQVEDMKTHFSNLDRFKQLVKMLTIIFSLGQPMPVNHQGKIYLNLLTNSCMLIL